MPEVKEAQDMGGAIQAHDVGPILPEQKEWDRSQLKFDKEFIGGRLGVLATLYDW